MNNFRIEQEIKINAKPAKVFERLTGDVSPWWDHSFSEAPKAVVLEAKLGGRFYEDFGDGNGAIYCTVMQLEKDAKLVLVGQMGMGGAVYGNITFELVADGAATVLKLSHSAIGDVTDEHKKNYSQGWQDLLGKRLKSLVETGKAAS